MSLELISALTVSGVVSSIIAGAFEIFVLKKYRKAETLEVRINKLASALRESGQLVSEVEAEIAIRQQLVLDLQKDAETYKRLVEMNKDQVDAVAQVLQGELRKEGRKSFWLGVAVNFFFFALGAALTWYFKK